LIFWHVALWHLRILFDVEDDGTTVLCLKTQHCIQEGFSLQQQWWEYLKSCKFLVPELIEKFPAFYGAKSFIFVFTRPWCNEYL